jgi:hypothetical protein
LNINGYLPIPYGSGQQCALQAPHRVHRSRRAVISSVVVISK